MPASRQFIDIAQVYRSASTVYGLPQVLLSEASV